MPATTAELPLVRRFPALTTLPRIALCSLPTPLEPVTIGGRALLVKRDDRSADPIGGNKARGLEWILGDVGPGDNVVTVGPTGSNSALATATHAARRGARTTVIRWRQHLNPAAEAVDVKLRAAARVIDARNVATAYFVATLLRLRRRTIWVPAGAATPRAVLGHVNAGLELAAQLRDAVELPSRVFVALGTGGTAAGLALGFRIAELALPITAVRVVPRLLARGARVASLANRCGRLIERTTGETVPRVRSSDISIEHAFSGGEYGRPLADASGMHARAGRAGLMLDDTYTLKTCAAALASSEPLPLLWLTFDARILREDANHTDPGRP